MIRYIIVSVTSGILFAVMDGLLNANPLAQRLYQVYQPIVRPSINVLAGMGIDLLYGFVLAGLFLLLYRCLPGKTGLVKGISFALLVWILRVLMSAAASWMMFEVTVDLLLYTIAAGLLEMLVLGLFYGLTLKKEAGTGVAG